jgi:hypothetical protein
MHVIDGMRYAFNYGRISKNSTYSFEDRVTGESVYVRTKDDFTLVTGWYNDPNRPNDWYFYDESGAAVSGWYDGFFGHSLQGGCGVAKEVFLHLTLEVASLDKVLYEAVLQRVVGDDAQTTSGAQHLEALLEGHLEGLHLAIDLYAEGLEELGEKLGAILLGGAGGYSLEKLTGGDNLVLLAVSHNAGGNLVGRIQLAVLLEHPCQLLGRIGVYQLACGEPCSLIHPHIQRSVGLERESSLGGVEVVRRDAQVGNDAVDLAVHHATQAQLRAQKAEIALDEVVTLVTREVGLGVGILVEREEQAVVGQMGEEES